MKARSWDELWQDEASRKRWSQPDDRLAALLPQPAGQGRGKALDLGCGVGRHVVFLAKLGFGVSAIDSSEHAVAHCQRWVAQEGLRAAVCRGSSDSLPFRDRSFDLVVAWNVIYHARRWVMEAMVAEVRRVTRPNGLWLLTLISTRHRCCGQGVELEPDTYDNPAKEDGRHLHHYSSEHDVRSLLSGWRIESLREGVEKIEGEEQPATWHWIVRARNTRA